MKKVINTMIFSLAMLANIAAMRAGPGSDSAVCLELQGKILNAPDCRIQVLSNSKVLEDFKLGKRDKIFSVLLNTGNYYTIKISSEGFYDRLVCIDTKMVSEPVEIYDFSFETSLLPKSQNVKPELAEMPIAIIFFDEKKRGFDYNRDYTQNLKKELLASKSH